MLQMKVIFQYMMLISLYTWLCSLLKVRRQLSLITCCCTPLHICSSSPSGAQYSMDFQRQHYREIMKILIEYRLDLKDKGAMEYSNKLRQVSEIFVFLRLANNRVTHNKYRLTSYTDTTFIWNTSLTGNKCMKLHIFSSEHYFSSIFFRIMWYAIKFWNLPNRW